MSSRAIANESSRRRGLAVTKALLACGAVSSALYLVMDAVLSLRYGGYSYASQAVSELNANGAPTRSEFLALSAAYNLLLLAFSAGISQAAGDRRAGRIAAACFAASAAVGMATPLFFPLELRGADATFRSSMHGPMTLLGSVFIIAAIASGGRLRGTAFRNYSYVTIGVLLAFGIATALYIPRVAADESTPGMGLVERVNIYAYLVWVAAFAATLWPAADESE